MKEYDSLVESVNAIEGLTPEQKSAILGNAKALNVEVGTRGADLIKIKGENDSLKQKTATYSEFADSVAKYNLKAEDVKKMANLAGIEQTHADEKAELTRIAKEAQDETKALKQDLWAFKQEKELAPTISEAIKNFVDGEGKPVELKPTFAKQAQEEALKGIKDGDDPMIITDRINKALIQAKTNQDTFMKENGLVAANTSTHTVPEKTPTGSASGSVSTEHVQQAQKIMEEGRGSSDSAVNAIAALRQAQKQ